MRKAAPSRIFANRGEQLAEALAAGGRRPAGRRDRRHAAAALLAVSGGTTPAAFLRTLSTKSIAWDKVTVTLVDERFVPATTPRSNAAAGQWASCCRTSRGSRFRAALPRGRQMSGGAASEALQRLALAARRCDAGHGRRTATPPRSFRMRRSRPCSIRNRRIVLPVHAESAGEPRLTLTLAAGSIVKAAGIACISRATRKREVLGPSHATAKLRRDADPRRPRPGVANCRDILGRIAPIHSSVR